MYKIIFILVATVLILQGVSVFLVNTIASGSVEAAHLTAEIEKVEEKNAVIKTELLKYASFASVSSRAAELGFIDSRSFMTVNSPLKVAASTNNTH